MCSVCNIACSQAMSAVAWSPSTARGPRYRRARRSLASVAELATQCSTQPARVALVDSSVYLKPAELVDVALDVLARLTPCLNLGVGELGHKDLLDTIGANNRRK